jgi:acyl dehydratase
MFTKQGGMAREKELPVHSTVFHSPEENIQAHRVSGDWHCLHM